MKLSKMEKLSYVGSPWFFGMVLTICGIIISFMRPVSFQGIALICAGLVCISIYCICALLARIVEKD
jgi:hypothetical protein